MEFPIHIYIHLAPSSGMDMGGLTRAAGSREEVLGNEYA